MVWSNVIDSPEYVKYILVEGFLEFCVEQKESFAREKCSWTDMFTKACLA